MRQATLAFVRRDDQILLGMKKKGFGSGKFNGFGGKVNEGETIEAAAKRELWEESGIVAELVKHGELTFKFKDKPEWDQKVHVFVASSWHGEPIESDEMAPVWTDVDKIPFDKMWVDDQHWLPHVLEGKNVTGFFTFEGEVMLDNQMLIFTPLKGGDKTKDLNMTDGDKGV